MHNHADTFKLLPSIFLSGFELIGKLEVIGEWGADGFLQEVEERRIMDIKGLKKEIKQKVYELDMQLLLAGLPTILGIHQDAGEKRFSLEVHVPLMLDDESEYDLDMLQRRAMALRALKQRGYYLENHREGYVKCFVEGSLNDLEGELSFVEEALVAPD